MLTPNVAQPCAGPSANLCMYADTDESGDDTKAVDSRRLEDLDW